MFKNAPPGWAIKLVKHIYSNDLIKVFEDTLDLDGEEKIYTRAIRRNYSTIVRPHICSYHYFHKNIKTKNFDVALMDRLEFCQISSSSAPRC
jgi:hypothetical protein